MHRMLKIQGRMHPPIRASGEFGWTPCFESHHNDSVLKALNSWRNLMGTLTVRNLDDRVIERLKAQARENQRSLEGEIRHMLTERVDRRRRLAEFRERTRELASMTAGTPQTDSVTLLRNDRDR